MDRTNFNPEVTGSVRTLIAKWRDREANEVYIFTELKEYEDGQRTLMKQENGDKEWAERMAKHYKLELPELKESVIKASDIGDR